MYSDVFCCISDCNEGNGGILAPEPIRRPLRPPQPPVRPVRPYRPLGCMANTTHFQCAQRIHECIPRYLLCDGEFDCTDGSDEFTCSSIRTKRGIEKSNKIVNVNKHECSTGSDHLSYFIVNFCQLRLDVF